MIFLPSNHNLNQNQPFSKSVALEGRLVSSAPEVLVSLVLLAPQLLLLPPAPHVSTISGVPAVVSILTVVGVPAIVDRPDFAGIPAV